MGDCKYCGTNAGFLRGKHPGCEDIFREGWDEMVAVAAESARTGDIDPPGLRRSLAAIAERSFIGSDRVDGAIAEGWRQAVSESLSDGILTRQEEADLRDFRDHFAIDVHRAGGAVAELERAVHDRLSFTARQAALAVGGNEAELAELSLLLDESGLSAGSRRELLVHAWEAALEELLEDRNLSLEEEGALVRYMSRFDLQQEDVNANGAYMDLVKAIVLREVMEGEVPERISTRQQLPFNLMKSEKLVWVIDQVDYIRTKTRRIRQGTSHGLSIRVARGLYYRPGVFRSEAIEHEETVHADTGLLGVTSKHLYFHGATKRFRIRYDKIVSFEPYRDGLGVMRDSARAKPEGFLTGDGWFIYNLVTNLAQNG